MIYEDSELMNSFFEKKYFMEFMNRMPIYPCILKPNYLRMKFKWPQHADCISLHRIKFLISYYFITNVSEFFYECIY